jgi:alkaline phosphatase
MSAEKIVRSALNTIGLDVHSRDSFKNKTVQTEFLRELLALVSKHTGLTLLRRETALLEETTALFPKLGAYACQRAVGAIVSARAKLGWSSFGHTGVDVNLHTFGPGNNTIRGSIENEEIGSRLAAIMGWDLNALTEGLGVPVMASVDVQRDEKYASWAPLD